MALLAAGMPVPVPAPETAEGLTKPNVDIRCNVLARDGAVRSMRFQLNGAQGYPTGTSPKFAATEAILVVEGDQTGTFAPSDRVYDNVTSEKFEGSWKNGKLGRFGKGGTLSFVQFFPAGSGAAAVLVEQNFQPFLTGRPVFAYAGMCSSTDTQQRPLSAAPAQKDRRQ